MSQISSPKRERWLKRRGNLQSPGGRLTTGFPNFTQAVENYQIQDSSHAMINIIGVHLKIIVLRNNQL